MVLNFLFLLSGHLSALVSTIDRRFAFLLNTRLWWTVALEELLELVGHVQGRQELQMATVMCGLQGLHQNFHVWYVAIIRLGNLAHLTYGFWFYLAI